MSKYFRNLFFLGFITLSINVFAQEKNTEDKFEKFKKELDLSDAQVLKIKAIKEKNLAEKTRLKERLKEIKNQEIEEIDRLYTPEQRAKLKAILEKHRKTK